MLIVAALAVAACGASKSSSSSSTAAASSGSGGGSSAGQTEVGFEGVPIQSGPGHRPGGHDPDRRRSTGSTADPPSSSPTTSMPTSRSTSTVSPRAPRRHRDSRLDRDPDLAGTGRSGGQCIYWLHTHAPDGVIHVESPTERIYTLGDFFDEWHQPLSANRVGARAREGDRDRQRQAVDQETRGDPAAAPHVIQLSVGSAGGAVQARCPGLGGSPLSGRLVTDPGLAASRIPGRRAYGSAGGAASDPRQRDVDAASRSALPPGPGAAAADLDRDPRGDQPHHPERGDEADVVHDVDHARGRRSTRPGRSRPPRSPR